MLAEVDRTDADLVVASRRVPHGDADSLPWLRAAVSRFSTATARRLFGRRLEAVSDPMSGFFLVRRSSLDLEQLRFFSPLRSRRPEDGSIRLVTAASGTSLAEASAPSSA